MFNNLKALNFGLSLTKYQQINVFKEHAATGISPVINISRNAKTDSKSSKDEKFILKGKKVLYIGGMGNIGFETIRELISKKIKSVLVADTSCDSNKIRAWQQVNPKTKIDYIKFDLRSGQQKIAEKMQSAFDRLKGFDILINGAGIVNDRNVDKTVTVNLLGVIETTIAAVPLMSKSEKGCGGIICYVSSVFGLEPAGCVAVYSATKHGIVGLSKSLAHPDYEEITGISHITVCPGPTRSKGAKTLVGVDTFRMSKRLSEKMLLNKNQSAKDCGKNIVKSLEKGKNGSFWMVDKGNLCELKMHKYWEMTLKD